MANENICSDCGLPTELCLCEDESSEEDGLTEVKLVVQTRSGGNKMTELKGFSENDPVDEICTELKSTLAAGGTVEETEEGLEIHIQGDHRDDDRLDSVLEDYKVSTN